MGKRSRSELEAENRFQARLDGAVRAFDALGTGLLQPFARQGSEGVRIGAGFRLALLARINVVGEKPARVVSFLPRTFQAYVGEAAERKRVAFAGAGPAVLEAPELAAARLNSEIQAMAVAELVRLALGLRIGDGRRGE